MTRRPTTAKQRVSPPIASKKTIPPELLASVLDRLNCVSVESAAAFFTHAYPIQKDYAEVARQASARFLSIGPGPFLFKILRKIARGEVPQLHPGVQVMELSPLPHEKGWITDCLLRFFLLLPQTQQQAECARSVDQAMAPFWAALGINPATFHRAQLLHRTADIRGLANNAFLAFERERAAFWIALKHSIEEDGALSLSHVDQLLAAAHYAAPWQPDGDLENKLRGSRADLQSLSEALQLDGINAVLRLGALDASKELGDRRAPETSPESQSSHDLSRPFSSDPSFASDPFPSSDPLPSSDASFPPSSRVPFEPETGWKEQNMTFLRALACLEADKPTVSRLKNELAQRKLEQEAKALIEKQHQAQLAAEAHAKWQAHQKWESELVPAADMPERLDITKTEYLRWRAEGKIPVSTTTSFRKWGQTLQVSYHHPDDFAVASVQAIALWRSQHKEKTTARRKEAAKAGAQARLITQAIERAIEVGFTPLRHLGREKMPLFWSARRKGAVVLHGETFEFLGVFSLQLKPQEGKLLVPTLLGELQAQFEAVDPAAMNARVQDRIEKALNALQMGVPPTGLAAADVDHPEYDARWVALRRLLGSSVNLDHLSVDSVQGALQQAQEAHRQQQRKRKAQEGFLLKDYTASFPLARSLGRHLHVITGPTNSGKTHEALEALKTAASGIYLAPLRLLAMEVYDRLTAQGIPCDLRTGEERLSTPGARHVCATVEMMDPEEEFEVAVIDECQMIFDPQRGAAWTAALAGVAAKSVYALGAATIEPLLQKLVGTLGEPVDWTRVERKTPLTVLDHSVSLGGIRAGDAVIAFSRRNVLRLAASLRNYGHDVATIYGALTPEVRRAQAELFLSGRAQVLVATDAIGMGMNLPIARVVFSEIEKFDGEDVRPLTPAEAQQIGGRAGRFGLHAQGEVSTMNGALSHLHDLMHTPQTAQATHLRVGPSLAYVTTIAQRLGLSSLAQTLEHFDRGVEVDHAIFEKHMPHDLLFLAHQADVHSSRLSLAIRFKYACAPVSTNQDHEMEFWHQSIQGHAQGKVQHIPAIPHWLNKPRHDTAWDMLQEAEGLSKRIALYAWLAYAFPSIFVDAGAVESSRRRLAGFINAALRKQVEPTRRSSEYDFW